MVPKLYTFLAALLLPPAAAPAADLPPLPSSTPVISVPAGHNFWEPAIGGRWVSEDFDDGKGHKIRQEMTFAWLDGQHGIRGDLYVCAGSKQLSHETEIVAYNPVDKAYYVLAGDTAGNVKQSRATVKDGVMTSNVTESLATGMQYSAVGRFWMPDSGHIEVQLFMWKNGGYQLLRELHMTRRAGA